MCNCLMAANITKQRQSDIMCLLMKIHKTIFEIVLKKKETKSNHASRYNQSLIGYIEDRRMC